MSELKYEEVQQLSRDDIEQALASGEETRMADALYSATRFSEDWRWPQKLCLDFVTSPHLLVRWAAVTCLGDIAALEKAMVDPAISDPAGYSLSMVKQFIRK